MNKTKVKINFFAVILTALIILFSSVITTFFANPSKVSAATNGAVTIGGGAELYNATTNSFNSTVVNDLKEKIFGDKNPKDFVKNSFDPYTPTAHVVSAKVLNDLAGTDYGFRLKLGGLDWIVASLTMTDLAYSSSEDVVLTLYLAESLGDSIYYSNGTNTRGNNAYARSVLRKNLLEHDRMQQFLSGDITQFLV